MIPDDLSAVVWLIGDTLVVVVVGRADSIDFHYDEYYSGDTEIVIVVAVW